MSGLCLVPRGAPLRGLTQLRLPRRCASLPHYNTQSLSLQSSPAPALWVRKEKAMKTIVIVGFKVNQDNSVFYRKLPNLTLGEASDDARLLSAFKSAIGKSDFISVRVVREGNNE